MGRIVIACYRPHPGGHAALRALVADHVPRLRSLGLVTDRAPIVMEAQDGTIIEVFEWVSPAALETAHAHPAVLALWDRFSEVCDFVPIAEVPEAAQMFSEFAALATAFAGPPPTPGPGRNRPPVNEFGDPVDTLYAGGTPRFDETGGTAPVPPVRPDKRRR